MSPLATDRPLVDQLRESYSTLVGELDADLQARKAARDAERAEFWAAGTDEDRKAHIDKYEAGERSFGVAYAAKEAECDQLRARIGEEERNDARKADAAAHAPSGLSHIGDPPAVYRRDQQADHSYWADLACMHGPGDVRSAFKNRTNPQDAEERLKRHAVEMDVRAKERAAGRERRLSKMIDDAMDAELAQFRGRGIRAARIDGPSVFERRVNPSTIDGQGGYFDPPEWMVGEFIPYLRAGRVAADLCRHFDVPAGYSSVNIPKVTTPTLVAAQGANNVAVVSQDIQDSAVATGFRTFAGQEDVAVQWLDMSPGRITDEVVTEDLTAAYNLCLDNSVVNGNATVNSTGTGGPLCGLYPYTNWSATNVTCTQGSPTPANLFGTFGAQLSQIAQSRFDTTNTGFLVHPRRAYWYMFGLDGSSARPFIESEGFAPWNPGALEEEMVAEGFAFTWPSGHKVHISKNVTTADATNGASAADVSIAAKWDDVWLFESTPRARVLQEVLSGTLQVRFQIYNYAGLIVRYGGSIAIAAGTGFAAPTVNSGSF